MPDDKPNRRLSLLLEDDPGPEDPLLDPDRRYTYEDIRRILNTPLGQRVMRELAEERRVRAREELVNSTTQRHSEEIREAEDQRVFAEIMGLEGQGRTEISEDFNLPAMNEQEGVDMLLELLGRQNRRMGFRSIDDPPLAMPNPELDERVNRAFNDALDASAERYQRMRERAQSRVSGGVRNRGPGGRRFRDGTEDLFASFFGEPGDAGDGSSSDDPSGE